MAARAKDIMQTRVVSVGVDDPLSSVHRLFADEEISGAPVVDERGEVVGVVTIRDLLRDERDSRDEAEAELAFYREDRAGDLDMLRDGAQIFADRLAERTAGDAMTANVVSVSPDAPVPDIVRTVLDNRIHRVLVTEDRESGRGLVGIISLFDLVALLA
jgi:CBS domain-containing protein